MATSMQERRCTGCRLPQAQWKGNDGEGVWGEDGQAFCCAECAAQAGCVCTGRKR